MQESVSVAGHDFRPKPATLLNYLVGVIAASAVALRRFAARRSIGGIPGQRLAASLGAAACGLKLAHICVQVAKKQVPAGRILLPAILFLELLRIALGQATRAGMLAVLLCFELLVIVFAIVQLRRLGPAGRDIETETEVQYERMFGIFLPESIAALLARELVTLWAGIRWAGSGFRVKPVPGFSYAQNSTMRLLPLIVPMITLGDEIVLGVLLRHQAAWIRLGVIALDVWAVLWVFGVYATFEARPHQIEGRRARLRIGTLAACEFDPALVIKAAPCSEELSRKQKQSYGLLTAHGTPTVKLQLREPVLVRRFGRDDNSYDTLLVAVDDPATFCRALERMHG